MRKIMLAVVALLFACLLANGAWKVDKVIKAVYVNHREIAVSCKDGADPTVDTSKSSNVLLISCGRP
jgi:hypothetical protein